MDLTVSNAATDQGESQLNFSAPSSRSGCDVSNGRNVAECCDNDLLSVAGVAGASLSSSSSWQGHKIRAPKSHVNLNPMSDLVAQSPLAECQANSGGGRRKSKSLLVKSNTCCDFSEPIPIRPLQRKKLFPSFSHPDTSFVFTDDDQQHHHLTGVSGSSPADSPTSRRNWRRRADPDLELTWPLSSSSSSKENKKRISVLSTSFSENQLRDLTGDGVAEGERCAANKYKIIPVHPELSVKVRESDVVEASSDSNPNPILAAAQRYFEESGILGPVAMGNSLFRKSSKVHIIDNLQFEQVSVCGWLL